jgi:hypothetical protein
MEFVLLIKSRRGEAPRAEVGVDEMGKFAQELAQSGALRGAAGPLRPESEAARVQMRDGRAAITDGPFAESREVLGGLFAVEAADRAAAIELAKRCPWTRAGTVELRAGRYLRGPEPSGAPRFLLLYLLGRDAPVPDEARIRQGMKEMRAFTDSLAEQGQYLGDGALPPQLPAAQVTNHQGRAVVTDGPFAESKEILAGFAFIEAANRAEAIEIAQRVPHAAWGAVEVREVATSRS